MALGREKSERGSGRVREASEPFPRTYLREPGAMASQITGASTRPGAPQELLGGLRAGSPGGGAELC